jgi:hypothetical protein
MLTPEERHYLYWLGAEVWSGRGCVVEIGSWLGGSTACLAAGIRASGHPAAGRLRVFDSFVWREFMAARAPLPLAPGDSFQPDFLRYTEPFAAEIVAEARALPDEEIAHDGEAAAKRFSEGDAVPPFDGTMPEPVEVLFVDGAKSWRGMRHLLLTLAGSLLPGSALLVCQDFKYWAMYWVPILVMLLADRLEPVHVVTSATTVTFRLTDELPAERIRELEDHVARLSTSECLDALAEAAGLLEELGDTHGAWHLRLATVAFHAHQGRTRDAVSAFDRIQSRWPLSAPTAQLDLARGFLAREKNQVQDWPLRLRVQGSVQRVAGALARRLRRT